MRLLLSSAIALSLPGCAALSSVGITPASAPPLLAIAAETRAAANCIRDQDAGRPPNRVTTIRIRNARRAFDVTAGMTLSENARGFVQESRDDADLVCPPLVTAPPPPQ